MDTHAGRGAVLPDVARSGRVPGVRKGRRMVYERPVGGPVLRGDRVAGERVAGFAFIRSPAASGRNDRLLLDGDESFSAPPERPLPAADTEIERCGPLPTAVVAGESILRATEVAEHLPESIRAAIRSMGVEEGRFATALIAKLAAEGHLFWLVGGTVRDLIADGPQAKVKDLDCTGTARPGELYDYVDDALDVRAGISDHVFKLHVSHRYVWSVRNRTGGRAFIEYKSMPLQGFRFPASGGDLHEDVRTRDLTVNCLYYDPVRDVVLDPTERGLADLRAEERALVSPNESVEPLERAKVILRALKFTVRWRGEMKLDADAIRKWSATLPGDLLDHITDEGWRELGHVLNAVYRQAPAEYVQECATWLDGHAVGLIDAIEERTGRVRGPSAAQ
ncbi:hypothetical protein [Actinomadura bangladeshensis]|uniref:hypothetical protein n=1 Tax=Actinomadura bangladeshensis TaxID=453573 RepID=UPI0013D06120